jgi:DNA-directed RNA polymerase II subunit RPB11
MQDLESQFRMKERNPQPSSKFYPSTEEDRPAPDEHIVLLEGEEKVVEHNHKENANTSTFSVKKEDHTLGNLISQRLLTYDSTVFAAYKIATPHETVVDLRVTTDGTITPKEAVIKCCKDVIVDLENLKGSFKQELEIKRIFNEYDGK